MSNITAAMLSALLGRPVAYQQVCTKLPGVSLPGAVFLSQALFWTNTPTAQRRGGWFYKKSPEDPEVGEGDGGSWEEELGMSAKQQ